MAIIKRYRKSGLRYQIKIKGSDGKWISETFDSMAKAEKKEAELRILKLRGDYVTNISQHLTVAEFFDIWIEESKNGAASEGWMVTKRQMYRDYVAPIIGSVKLQHLNPATIHRVMSYVTEVGRGPSVQTHVYNLMHKLFGDAEELYEILSRNPVISKLRPKIPYKESPYLEIEELAALLNWVKGKPYGVAIWLQAFAGLRVGEVQYLKWENVDLDRGIIHVRGTYLRRENRFQDHPKGRKWHRVKMPQELWRLLLAQEQRYNSVFVATSPYQSFLGYHGYSQALTRYCKQAGVRVISSHGLRHSTAELYMSQGASRDDLRILFAHQAGKTTDRYVHDKGRRLDQVADNVLLFSPGIRRLAGEKAN